LSLNAGGWYHREEYAIAGLPRGKMEGFPGGQVPGCVGGFLTNPVSRSVVPNRLPFRDIDSPSTCGTFPLRRVIPQIDYMPKYKKSAVSIELFISLMRFL
jgi:hypothetical protein